jgi:2,3-bisphosphoglycerate-independent phosphoglycerate mutase
LKSLNKKFPIEGNKKVKKEKEFMKYLFVILDGAADRPCKELDGKTPLEAAEKRNINQLARKCEYGMIKVLPFAPESDEALLTLLGYNIEGNYTGRGFFEALGLGINVKRNQLCFRTNFATERNGIIIDRRVGRSLSLKESKILEKEINKIKIEGASFKFRAFGYRGAIVFTSKHKLSANLSDTDEAYARYKGLSKAKRVEKIKVTKCRALSKEAKFSARMVNSFLDKAKKVLENSEVNKIRREKGLLEANILLLRDPSLGIPKFEKISKIYKLKFAAIAEMPVEVGIAKFLGMKIIKQKKQSYSNLAELAKKALRKSDFVYLHIKGPDEFGHDGNAIGKKECIEKIDREFFSKIKNLKVKIAITSDHATPCSLKAHSSDAVPFLISPGDKNLENFCEKECKKGIKMKGNEFLKYFISKK